MANNEKIMIGNVIESLLMGARARRSSWFDGECIYYVPEGKYPVRTDAVRKITSKDTIKYNPYIAKALSDRTIEIWQPKTEDLLASDWVILG